MVWCLLGRRRRRWEMRRRRRKLVWWVFGVWRVKWMRVGEGRWGRVILGIFREGRVRSRRKMIIWWRRVKEWSWWGMISCWRSLGIRRFWFLFWRRRSRLMWWWWWRSWWWGGRLLSACRIWRKVNWDCCLVFCRGIVSWRGIWNCWWRWWRRFWRLEVRRLMVRRSLKGFWGIWRGRWIRRLRFNSFCWRFKVLLFFWWELLGDD